MGKEMKELWEIVAEWLKENGYDGLVDEDMECACLVSELMPCGEPKPGCMAGYKKEVDPSTGYDFCVVLDKP